MGIFEERNIKPMMIGEMRDAFDSPDYIYELKLDGIRAVVYLDSVRTDLRNKRNLMVTSVYPELRDIHKQVKKCCILDGEIAVINNGKPDFSEVQRRSLMSNKFKIQMAVAKLPVCFTAFDILYLDGQQLTDLPLMERKKLLEKTVDESPRLAVSRFIEEKGVAFYALAEQNGLEGIVAKRKDSRYYFDKRTKDWIKIKNLQDDDFVVCGYIEKESNVVSIVLGQYRTNQLVYKGHVTLGISGDDFKLIQQQKSTDCPFFAAPKGNEKAVWLAPDLVCTVKYMEKTESGSLRQPVFKGLRVDKLPGDCIEKDG